MTNSKRINKIKKSFQHQHKKKTKNVTQSPILFQNFYQAEFLSHLFFPVKNLILKVLIILSQYIYVHYWQIWSLISPLFFDSFRILISLPEIIHSNAWSIPLRPQIPIIRNKTSSIYNDLSWSSSFYFLAFFGFRGTNGIKPRWLRISERGGNQVN